MLDPSKAKTHGPTGKLTSEFTSNQLIISICLFLIVALVCFILGVVVGKYEVNASHNTLARVPQTPPPAAPAPHASEPAGKQEGVQTSPRTIPAATPQKPPEPGFPSSAGTPGAPPAEPKATELPAPPAKPTPPAEPAAPAAAAPAPSAEQPAAAAPAAAENKTQPAAPAAPATATPAPAQPPPATPAAPAAPAAAAPETAAATSAASPAEEPKTAKGKAGKTKDAKAKDAAPETVPTKGAYCIQVASCAGASRKENAETFKKRVQANANLNADLIPSADGKRICIVVGDYPDKESANKACAELKKRAGFADCYVKSRK